MMELGGERSLHECEKWVARLIGKEICNNKVMVKTDQIDG